MSSDLRNRPRFGHRRRGAVDRVDRAFVAVAGGVELPSGRSRLSLLTEDVEVHDDSWPRTMHGHADVREFLEALWRAVPDMTFELLDGPYVIPGEPRASFHWRGFGTFTGRMDPPGFAPTGRRWEVDGADFHEYRDGRIAKPGSRST